jgi:hypothetical protein
MKTNLQKLLSVVCLLLITPALANNYVIYSVSQNIPMGYDNEVVKKNYYVNMGLNQGVKEGTILAVYRRIVKQDPYETKTRYSHKVKLGEVKVLHAENNTAITTIQDLDIGTSRPMIEIEAPMIGDSVEVVTQ